jgi:GDP-4-dehydro-6-deoxy-D-mannose reductase
VCSGQAVSMADILRLLCECARIQVEIQSDPALYRPHDAPVIVGDNRRLVRATGWHPSIPLEQTLDDLLSDWRRRVSQETGAKAQ